MVGHHLSVVTAVVELLSNAYCNTYSHYSHLNFYSYCSLCGLTRVILSSRDIQYRLSSLVLPADDKLINPASLDIRLGAQLIQEDGTLVSILRTPYMLEPGEFVLVETYEIITVPMDLAVELRLKSSIARQGYNHSLAFWFDPGWSGRGTMEIQNINRQKELPLYEGMKFAQLIFHKLNSVPLEPYGGKYQWTQGVQAAR